MNFFNKTTFWLKKIKRKITDFFVWIKKKILKTPKQTQTDWDLKLVSSLSRSKIPGLKQLKYIKKFLSSKELWLIRFLVLIIFLNLVFLGFNFYQKKLEVVPKQEGTYIEGLVGNPQYINPLYASINDVDKDISNLVYSSLFNLSKDKGLKKDLVEKYEVNKKKTKYTLTLKKGVKWHNGKNLSVDDVIFTFKAIKNSKYNSPLKKKFAGVEVSKVDNHKIEFLLSESNPFFLQKLRFGIIPRFLWSEITPGSARLAELNLKPVGSGPYKFKSLIKDKYGNILDYKLEVNKEYYKKEPYIENLEFKFFASTEEAINALNTNEVDGLAHIPREFFSQLVARDSLNIRKLQLPRINSLFFNEKNNSILKDTEIRRALTLAINKERIISKVLGPAGFRNHSPLPEFSFYNISGLNKHSFNITKAEEILKEKKWLRSEITKEEISKIKEKEEKQKEEEEKKEEEEENTEKESLSVQEKTKLTLGAGKWRVKKSEKEDSDKEDEQYFIVELAYPQQVPYEEIAGLIKEYWEEVGVKTVLRPVKVENLNSRVIEKRNFQTLLYAQVFEIYPDLYSFWHSSQAEKGLNISGYKNEKVDKLLEEARNLKPFSEEKMAKYKEVQKIINREIPAIFIYSTYYNYIQSKKIKGFEGKKIYSPSDRFVGISDWYIKTGKKIKW